MPLSALKFNFLQITFFSAVITRTHTPTHTHSVFPTHYALKNALNTFFIKLHSFPLYSFCLPPKHFLIIFRQTSDQKWTKNLPKGGKNFFPFFIIFFTCSLSPYGQKQNHLLFPPFLSLEIEKSQGKASHKKFFFFFFI